jgi:xanthine dehydrogenase YagT iron-sulfur-binding subunit
MYVRLTVNGRGYTLDLDPRESLLDVLRERLDLTGTKRGCDQGACGACTVHIDGRRVLSCLTLAARCEGKQVTTIEGVVEDGQLHPLQRAMIEHDGLQCGYCTPGQIMAGIALLEESCEDAGGDPRVDERQPLSLRCAQRHRRGDRAGARGDRRCSRLN